MGRIRGDASGTGAGRWRSVTLLAGLVMVVGVLPAAAGAQTTDDPRFGLGAGFEDAETASVGLDHVAHFRKADTPFFDPENIGSIAFANSDIAFTGDHVIQGNWRGFQIFDVSDPGNPQLRTSVLCPGGQGDVNVYGNLMFHSVEDASGRVDCGTEGNAPGAQESRFRGVRIWDISDLDNPVQVGGLQLCRGSHTHRLVEDTNDSSVVYIYNSGTAGQRSPDEAVHTPEGFVTDRCGQTDPAGDDPSMWMVEVARIPVDNPAAAEVVNEARLFQDPATGALDGLQNTSPGTPHPCSQDPAPEFFCDPAGPNYGPTPNTNTCHDITAYPEIGLAAGACQGNGLLIDISDPANPVRIDAVADPNFSYWHSANFNNDGTTVMFTDEWGGGVGPRCAANHRTEWGGNAIFEIVDTPDGKQLEFRSYYKLPPAQVDQENCVAHQANILPVPGRDIVVQAWYQGGVSVFDMTDPANPSELAYFDRGPISPTSLVLGGFWSAYWYNGQIYGGEIARGVDVFEAVPTEQLSANEIAAAKEVVLDEHNAMAMRQYVWAPSFNVVRAHRDQLARTDDISPRQLAKVDRFVDRAERFADGPQIQAARATLRAIAGDLTGDGQQTLAEALRDLADAL